MSCVICRLFGQTIDLPFTGSDHPWEITSFNFTDKKWDENGKDSLAVVTYMNKKSVHLKAGTVLYTKGLDFKDGSIEVDVSLHGARNFPGIAFRMKDLDNCEHFYIGAQKDGFIEGFPFMFDTWHHLKIDVYGLKADVYIDDMQTPLYKIPGLKGDWTSGDIALFSDEADIHFANARYTPRK